MTALSFPPSPDTGAIYEAPNNTVYIFDGQKWNVQGTTVTAAATVNFIQDTIAPIFTNIQGEGISFSYNNSLNVLTASLTGYIGSSNGYTGSRGDVGYTGSAGSDNGSISVLDFGDGFELDNADKIVTRKLYSTNPSDSNVHYRLELTNGGTIKLPDQSEINGSTLKGIYGTGELNYTGITIGPSSGNSENTWMWVDASNAYIATDYADNQYTWTFGNDGVLTFPSGNMTMGDLNGSEGIQGSANTPIGVLAQGTSGAATLQWINDFESPTAISAVVVNSPFANTGSVQIVTGAFDPMNLFAEHSWTFGNDGKLSLPSDIKFSDDTVQTTAWTGSNPINYANIINVPIAPEVDIDGGHALAYFTIPASADGGGSSQRFGPNSPTINGGVAIETHTNTLDGGGA